jgi:hypothetical protein
MALVKCVECGADISDKAISCPKCGCPEPFTNPLYGNCPECYAKIPLKEKICPVCGLPNPHKGKVEGSPKNPNRDAVKRKCPSCKGVGKVSSVPEWVSSIIAIFILYILVYKIWVTSISGGGKLFAFFIGAWIGSVILDKVQIFLFGHICSHCEGKGWKTS